MTNKLRPLALAALLVSAATVAYAQVPPDPLANEVRALRKELQGARKQIVQARGEAAAARKDLAAVRAELKGAVDHSERQSMDLKTAHGRLTQVVAVVGALTLFALVLALRRRGSQEESPELVRRRNRIADLQAQLAADEERRAAIRAADRLPER